VFRDSAGISIAEGTSPSWSPGAEWTVAPDPVVAIGQADGPEEYQLYRPASATRLPDGRIIVANSGSSELRFYDAAGQWLQSVGGDGEGPGEFRSMGAVWPLGDSLFVADWRLIRVTVFDRDGVFARSFQVSLPEEGSFPLTRGVFAPGALLVEMGLPDAELGQGLIRDSLRLISYTLEGEPGPLMGVYVGSERYMHVEQDFVATMSRPFGLEAQRVAGGDRVWFGSSDTYEILGFAADGSLTQIIRRPVPNEPVTADDRAGQQAEIDERAEEASAMWRKMYESMTFPETKPAYGRFVLDRAGHLWVSEPEPDSEVAQAWNVFASDGTWLGTTHTPAGMRVLEIGPDYVLGRKNDDLGVAQIRLHKLEKPRT